MAIFSYVGFKSYKMFGLRSTYTRNRLQFLKVVYVSGSICARARLIYLGYSIPSATALASREHFKIPLPQYQIKLTFYRVGYLNLPFIF